MMDTGKDKYIATDANTNTALALYKPAPLIKKSQTNLNNELKNTQPRR
jgi:hypothetical protein